MNLIPLKNLLKLPQFQKERSIAVKILIVLAAVIKREGVTMKKFSTVLVLILAIVCASTPAKADAISDEIAQIQRIINGGAGSYSADVPDFAQFGGSYLKFTGKENSSNSRGNYVVYGYDCSVDLQENFAEQFMNYLVQNFPFQFITHEHKKYPSLAKVRDHWYFKYVGSKGVPTFDALKPGSAKSFIPCHLNVVRRKDFQSGITHFSIRIARGLSYGG